MTTTASYDAANRLTSQGSTTFTYDNNGNRLTRSENGTTTTYGYDAANRLTTVSGPVTASYRYDGDGYRVTKTVNGTSTTYAWDRLGAGGLGTVIGDGTHGYVHGPAGLQQRVGIATARAEYAHKERR